jgi:O-antigen/teichoic acid export membrane protein
LNLKNISAFSVGTLGAAVAGIITIPLLTWLVSPEDIGRFNIYQLIIGFGVLFLSLGLDQTFARYYNENVDRYRLLLDCYLPGAFIFLLALIPIVWMRDEVSQFLYGEVKSSHVVFTALSVFVMYLLRISSVILRMNGNGVLYSINQVLPKGLLCVLLVLNFFLSGYSNFSTVLLLSFVALLVVIPQFTSVVFTYIKLNREGAAVVVGRRLSSLIYWAVTAIGSVLLKDMVGLDELGLYAVAINLAGVAVVFQNILSVVWVPIVYKWVSSNEDLSRIDRVLSVVLFFVLVLTSLVGVFSGLIDLLLPADYSEVKYLLTCAVLQPFFYALSEVSGIGVSVVKKTYLNVVGNFCVLILCFACAYFLIPLYGAAGAIMSNTIAFFVFLIFRTEFSARYWRDIPRRKLYLSTLACACLSIFCLQVKQLPVVIVCWVGALILVCAVFNAEVKLVVSYLSRFRIND